MLDTDRPRHDLIQDLYQWGPALTSDLRARYPTVVIRELTQLSVLARRKFTGFEVYLLTGKGLRRYGYTLRYNYVPARATVLGALILRAKAQEFRENGYVVEPYEDYTRRGRGNIALITKDGVTSALIGRITITVKGLRTIADHLVEQAPTVKDLKVFVLPGDHDPVLLHAQTVGGLPVTLTEVSISSITRPKGKAESGEGTEESEAVTAGG